MRVITNYQIGKLKGIIPNIERVPNITVEHNSIVDHLNRDVKLITYKYNNKVLFIVNYKESTSEASIWDFSSQVAMDSGLFLETPFCGRAVFDTLYYKANPSKTNLSKKNEKQLETYAKILYSRLRQRNMCRSQVTIDIVNKFIDHVTSTVPKPTEQSSLEEIKNYIVAVNAILQNKYEYNLVRNEIRYDISKLQWIDSSFGSWIKTRLSIFLATSPTTTMQRFNLELNNPRQRYNPYLFYIDPTTEIVYDGEIYLRRELDLVTCPECNREVQQRERVEEGCVHCMKELSKVHNYSTKVPDLLKFKATKVKPSTLYLGTELEYESVNDSRTKDAIYTNKVLKNHAILKSDGSIRHGFEIVTCPATLDIHLAEFKKFFSELKEKTKLHAENNTGMHVHISRKPLSMLTIGKMTAFLNNPKNKKFIESIGGRKLNHYCNQDEFRTVTYPLVYGKGERYNTLNLSNDATVEIRIFSTPETYEDFAHKLEFSEALAIYCSPCTVNHSVYKLTSHENFQDWVKTQKHSYPHLVNKLKSIQG